MGGGDGGAEEDQARTPAAALYTPEFVQCIVYLASQGTQFNRQWLVKDLEVLSLMLFSKLGSSATGKQRRLTKMSSVEKKAGGSVTPLDAVKSGSKRAENSPAAAHQYPAIEPPAPPSVNTIAEHYKLPLSLVNMLHDMHEHKTGATLSSIHAW